MIAVRRQLFVLLCLAVLGALPAPAAARVPATFVGMIVDQPLLSPQLNLGRQLSKMVSTGVGSLRTNFNWAAEEPYASWSEVPSAQRQRFSDADGMPVDFTDSDRIVAAAAAHHLTVLPVVLFCPGWAGTSDITPGAYQRPQDPATYARFAAALARRYGPQGMFWRSHPRLPVVAIRRWQIWNEPNLPQYWPQDQSGSTKYVAQYVALVHAAHDAIKGVDPGAQIVLAGTPNNSWDYLRQIYSIPGARRYFDIAAVHPFTHSPSGVLQILHLVRAVMNRAGDRRKPMLATEVSFPSALGQSRQHFGFETTAQGQARDLATLLPMLAAQARSLHLAGFYHYNWVTTDRRGQNTFAFGGLFRLAGTRLVAKPAYAAFRRGALRIEGRRP